MAHLNTNIVTKKNLKVVKTTVTGFTTPTTNWVTLNSSVISYSPVFDCSHVVYEYNTQMTYKDNWPQVDFQLKYGSDVNNLDDITSNNVGYFTSFGSNTTSSTRTSRASIPISIIFLIPAWQGEKVVCLQVKAESLSQEVYLDGIISTATGEAADDYFNPFCMVYSL
jgi:hypothetical protein